MVVRRHPETGDRHLDLLNWGLLPHFSKHPVHAKRPINARAETVKTSGIFRSAFYKRRCLVSGDAFYEWKPVEGGKQPYAIARQDDGVRRSMGGIQVAGRYGDTHIHHHHYDTNEIIGELHDRMPVILESPD
jgi:putative SOS response-associated peptidase YedK